MTPRSKQLSIRRFSGRATLLTAALVCLSAQAEAAKKKKAQTPAPADSPKVMQLVPAPEDAPLPGVNPHLQEARAAYESLEYDRILPHLEMALAMRDISLEQRVEIYRLKAFTHAAFGQYAEAEQALLELFTLKPKYELSGMVSPKMRELFAAAKQKHLEKQAVVLKHEPPAATQNSQSTSVDVLVTAGAERVSSITLHYRPRGTQTYSQVPLSAGEGGAYAAVVPNVFPGKEGLSTIEYFVRARDTGGVLLASLGAEDTPLELVMHTVEPGKPLYKSVPFWVGVGVVVAGGTAAAMLIRPNAATPQGTLGAVQLK